MQDGSVADPKEPSSGSPERLKRWGGLITGFAYTYSRALQASRAEIIKAVDGEGAIDTMVVVNGHRGTDHSGRAVNRIRSDEHPDRNGVDRVLIAVTPEQFETLAMRVGATVRRKG
ncbi:MAG: hypothetical protein ABEL51_08455 [Salinibacter sp.]